jgi:hypothetical protein
MPLPALRAAAPFTRRYDRRFDWEYTEERGHRHPGLPGIDWDGLDLNPGWLEEDFTAVVTNVDGWYGSPPLNGNDAERALADGATWGPKVLGARVVVIDGGAVGPLAALSAFRDQLSFRACAREPATLRIEDLGLGRVLTADVRAGTESFRHTFWAGNQAFRWQVALTASDPLLYGDTWNSVRLTNLGGIQTGRVYPRIHAWRYAQPGLPNSATLINAGNADAPVYARYEGDLTASRLTDGDRSILLREVDLGTEIMVATRSLVAEAGRGLTRAQYILPGSRPMVVPAFSAVTWTLYAAGSGAVTLSWRDAWT